MTTRHYQNAFVNLGVLLFRMDDDPDRVSFSPREVQCKTRLYSPFGVGTSIDFVYTYYYRMFRSEPKWAVCGMSARNATCNDLGSYDANKAL